MILIHNISIRIISEYQYQDYKYVSDHLIISVNSRLRALGGNHISAGGGGNVVMMKLLLLLIFCWR